jgi:hypothetical protein
VKGWENMKNQDYVYLIGVVYPYGEYQIMGIYTNAKEVLKTYHLLVTEDPRCTDEKYPNLPDIYRVPLNQFLGKKEEWAFYGDEPYFYCDFEGLFQVSVEDLEE